MDENSDTRFLVENLARSGQGLAVILKEDPKARVILKEYVNYLLSEKPRNYVSLSNFLAWWGERYVLPDVYQLLQGRRYGNITELGPGTGWLIKRLAMYGDHLYAVDKRWTLIEKHSSFDFLIQDMEKFPRLTWEQNSSEHLIVANQFLHCVENPAEILQNNRSDWLVVEVGSLTWRDQMREFGATPLSPRQVDDLFLGNGFKNLGNRRSNTVHVSLWRPT